MYISREFKEVVIPYRDDVRALIPHARSGQWNGVNMLAVPHRTEESRLLRNLGLDVPAPIADHYKWPGIHQPFAVQVKTCAMMTSLPRCYVLNRMGTGKTKAALWSFDWLRSQGDAKKMLVVAPLSTLNFTWLREIMETVPHLKAVVLTGPKERRLKKLNEPADIFIINHDGIGVLLRELLERTDIDTVCIDEAAVFRNSRSERSRYMQLLAKRRRWVWAMTGSPTPNEPTDCYGLLKLVTPDRAPKSFRALRDETMISINKFRWVPRNDAATVVASYLQPSVCFDLTDVVELPELIERQIDVEQGLRQKKAYEDLRKDAITQFAEGSVTAKNGAICYNKMAQVSCGYVYRDDGSYEILDNDMRLETMREIIEGSTRKVIVFAPFIHATRQISQYLDARKIKHFRVSGETPHHERDTIFRAFQDGNGHEPLVAHPGCMAHGLTLTAADTIVWFSPIPSLEIFEQANARITRVGQTFKQQIMMLAGTPIERQTYSRLRARRAVQNGILELLAEAIEE